MNKLKQYNINNSDNKRYKYENNEDCENMDEKIKNKQEYINKLLKIITIILFLIVCIVSIISITNLIKKIRYNIDLEKKYIELNTSFLKIINDEKIINILTISNYIEDGPEFVNSKQYINTKKEEFNKIASELINLLNKSNLEYNNIEEIKLSINNLYNNQINILEFLKLNKEQWEILNDKLVFDNEELMIQYNNLKSNLYIENVENLS